MTHVSVRVETLRTPFICVGGESRAAGRSGEFEVLTELETEMRLSVVTTIRTLCEGGHVSSSCVGLYASDLHEINRPYAISISTNGHHNTARVTNHPATRGQRTKS